MNDVIFVDHNRLLGDVCKCVFFPNETREHPNLGRFGEGAIMR